MQTVSNKLEYTELTARFWSILEKKVNAIYDKLAQEHPDATHEELVQMMLQDKEK